MIYDPAKTNQLADMSISKPKYIKNVSQNLIVVFFLLDVNLHTKFFLRQFYKEGLPYYMFIKT